MNVNQTATNVFLFVLVSFSDEVNGGSVVDLYESNDILLSMQKINLTKNLDCF